MAEDRQSNKIKFKTKLSEVERTFIAGTILPSIIDAANRAVNASVPLVEFLYLAEMHYLETEKIYQEAEQKDKLENNGTDQA